MSASTTENKAEGELGNPTPTPQSIPPSKSKLKRFVVVKTTSQIYEVYDRSDSEALDMVKFRTSRGFAGTPTQKGFNTIMTDTPLTEYKVLEATEVKT